MGNVEQELGAINQSKPTRGHITMYKGLHRELKQRERKGECRHQRLEKGTGIGKLNLTLSVVDSPLQKQFSRLKGDSDLLSGGELHPA